MKLIIIFLFTFILFVGALVWRADNLMFEGNLAKTSAGNRQQISAVVDAFDFELQNLANVLSLSFSEIEKSTTDYVGGAAYSRFQMLATLNPPPSENTAGDWQVGNAHYLEKAEVRNWAPSYISLALKSIKPKDFQMGSAQVFAINDPKRNPYLLFVSRGIRQWYIGILKTDVFQKLMDRQKGQANSVFVVNSQGQALGHTTTEYVGKMLSEDPLVAEIVKSALPSGAGQFNNLKQEKVEGVYEKIPMSNLYVVVTTPLAPLIAQRDDMRMQFLFMGLGLCLVGMAAFIFLIKNEDQSSISARANFPGAKPSLQSMPSIPVIPANAPAGIAKKSEGEKMSAYTKLASTLSHEMKQPLTSVLGHIQLALNMVSEQKVIDHLKRADKEARGAREIIQKLLVFAGEDKMEMADGNLEIIVQKALKNLEGRMSIKGVKLNKNIKPVSQFKMPGDLLIRSVESILTNSIEAMERSAQKNLSVHLEQHGNDIVLTIADSGEGMDSETVAKVFDPFFTTRSQGQHVGLGLSTAKGVIKESRGNIEIQSEKGKGTKVIVTFNSQESPLINSEAPTKDVLSVPPPATDKLDIARSLATSEGPSSVHSDPLLVDNTIDQLIDGAEPEELNLLKAKELTGEQKSQLPPAPAPESALEATVLSQNSVKIDRPSVDLKKKISKLDEAHISIRRPGEKV